MDSTGVLTSDPAGVRSPTPTFRDCLYSFEQRLRLCDPEVATANSTWELTVGALRVVELHWYEAHGIGQRDMKIKHYLDEL